MQGVVELHRFAGEELALLVGGMDRTAWSAPTPCEAWDVRALVNHVTAENLWVPELLAGRSVEEVGDRFDGDVLGDEPVTACTHAIEVADAAVSAPGALDGEVTVSYGAVPAATFIGHRFVDLVVHGWDLAAATGQERDLHPGLLAALWAEVEPQLEFFQASGLFGTPAAVSDDAPLQDRVLTALGRDPAWTPPAG